MVIALIGNIGSGKSTVANLFAKLNAQILSADQITRELMQPNTSAYQAIYQQFGAIVCYPDQTINRTYLRQLVFNDPALLDWLESLLHPLVITYINQAIEFFLISQKINHKSYLVIEIPIFIKYKTYFNNIDRILLIDCTDQLKISRAALRDNASTEIITRILHSQDSNQLLNSNCDDIIYNNSSLIDLELQVINLYCKYLDHHK